MKASHPGVGSLPKRSAKALRSAVPDMLEVPVIAKEFVGDLPAARVDDNPSPRVGVATARRTKLKPEKER
ncbi:hypothetical protein NMY22_g17454 [Coprinellus aureogranulatus]|nr:hypothetical protein NMY22_g17454 [Coprinellus aureogranulatus]